MNVGWLIEREVEEFALSFCRMHVKLRKLRNSVDIFRQLLYLHNGTILKAH